MTKQGLDHYQKLNVDNPDNDDALRVVYDGWAADYDHDNDATLGTVSQPKTVEILSTIVGKQAKILDAGCGTGLVGAELAKRGYHRFDGVDLSAEMLQHAKIRGYTNLFNTVSMTHYQYKMTHMMRSSVLAFSPTGMSKPMPFAN